jgi:hypothetical protein
MKSYLKPPPEERNGFKDPNHRERVRALPCLACKAENIEQRYRTEGHHKIGKGMGLKASDRLMFPLCDLHHNANFIRDIDKDKIETWSIHKSILSKWEERWGDQDELIELTNKLLETL